MAVAFRILLKKLFGFALWALHIGDVDRFMIAESKLAALTE